MGDISDERLTNAIQVNDDWITEMPDKVSAVDRDISLALRELQAIRLASATGRTAVPEGET